MWENADQNNSEYGLYLHSVTDLIIFFVIVDITINITVIIIITVMIQITSLLTYSTWILLHIIEL